MSQEEVVPEHPTSNEATIVNRYSIDVVNAVLRDTSACDPGRE